MKQTITLNEWERTALKVAIETGVRHGIVSMEQGNKLLSKLRLTTQIQLTVVDSQYGYK